MRHNKKNNHLGRKAAHRDAMLSNMATSLIMHKRIFTTVPKAKELRKFVEPIITTLPNSFRMFRRKWLIVREAIPASSKPAIAWEIMPRCAS